MNDLVSFHYIPIKIIIKRNTSEMPFTSHNVVKKNLALCSLCSEFKSLYANLHFYEVEILNIFKLENGFCHQSLTRTNIVQ
jgi:hypothetical protein